jgi:hypothetical protein
MDYVTARWAFINGVFHIFYWSAAQCAEKYLKAALLYNSVPVINFGHDLTRLHSKVIALDVHEMIPREIKLPSTTGLGRAAWQGKSAALFIDYLKRYGSPDNRYGLEGTYVNGPILHALDLVIAGVRGFMRGQNFFNADLLELSIEKSSGEAKFECEAPWMLNCNLLLEKLYRQEYEVGQTPELRKAFANMNIAFFAERNREEKTFGGYHFIGSPMYNNLIRLHEICESRENRDIIRQLRTWAKTHIKLPDQFKNQIS